MQAEDLAKRFDIPGALHFQTGPGGLVRAAVSTPMAEAELYLQGAHVTRWTPHGERPVLFVSSKSLFTSGKAIRGGVPVIFPWFGARADGRSGPAHGFARTMDWTVEGTKLDDGGKVEITLTLPPNDATRALGYSDFHLRYRVTIGAELEMELETHNNGSEPLIFEEALHTYFAVTDIHQASIMGLEGSSYIDKTDLFTRKTLGVEPLRLSRETDQVHVNTTALCAIHDPGWNRRIIVEKSGSASTVVGNPWVDKTKEMSDMANDEWRNMLCIETANAGENAVLLPPEASHKMTASIRVELPLEDLRG
jgi:glucose-6-phosphate 1-epimerase